MFLSKIKPLIISVVITVMEFIFFLVWGLNMNGGDEMGFSLITTYLLFPLTTLVLAAYLGYKNPIMLMPFVLITFAAQNFMPYIIYGTFEIRLIICFTLIPAIVGAAVGVMIKKIKK